MSFTHLQVRSGYSLFESTMTIDKLVAQAAELGFGALALTDEEVLHGAIPFYKACMKYGIKPIIGMSIQIEVDSEKVTSILLAKNVQGYKDLMQISTMIQTESSCSLTDIADFGTGIISILPSSNPFVVEAMREVTPANRVYEITEEYGEAPPEITDYGEEVSAQAEAEIGSKLQTVFTAFDQVFSDVYVGVERSDLGSFKGLDFPVVGLSDVRYLKEQDYLSFDCLQAMKQGLIWDDAAISEEKKGRHLADSSEMEAVFHEWPELLENTGFIAEQCQLELDFGRFLLPSFPVPTDETAHAYLRRISEEMLAKRYQTVDHKVRERLAYELGVIEELGFSDYFLIVADFVDFAKRSNILVGPGRGSSASSIVAYLLGITTVDPLKYNLLFERFLNPERLSMPDIDIDFSDVRRDEVITYVREKYGRDNVAQIITYGTFAARSLLRDLMKTMEINRSDQEYILQQVPANTNQPLLSYVQGNPDFAAYIKQSDDLRRLFSIGLKLEGLPRHTSTHAAGLVIGQGSLREHIPLMDGTGETYLSQYAMHELEAIGLLKIDILALRNLSFMERVLKVIKEKTGEQLDLQAIPLDDAATFRLLQEGKTNGIFQLESKGMRQALMQLGPTTFEDIVALNALYRPGPMEHIPQYIERKYGRKSFSYVHPDLAPILEETYGVLIYQEQIMQIAHSFAGFTLGEADVLRKAVSKKERKLMEEVHADFIAGSVRKGYEASVAEEIFSWIVKFADYGFPKSHSVAYSLIGYQLSYLKANYPHEFFTQLFGTISNEPQKMNAYIREAMDLGIGLLPPSVNRSKGSFQVEGDRIRIGLLGIKGVGMEAVKEIVRARKGKPFEDLFDFCLRTRGIKRNTLEVLILAGAFDEIHDNRASLLASIDQALERAKLFGDMDGQGSLFSGAMKLRPVYVETSAFSMAKQLADEMELLGMYVSEHPLKRYRDELAAKGCLPLRQVEGFRANEKVTVAGIVQGIRKIKTKKGESMAFISIADESAEMEGVVFPSVFRQVSRWLREESVIQINGKISIRQGNKQLIVDRMAELELEKLEASRPGTVYIRIVNFDRARALDELRAIASEFPGRANVIVHDDLSKETYKLDDRYSMSANEASLLNLMGLFGASNVVYRK